MVNHLDMDDFGAKTDEELVKLSLRNQAVFGELIKRYQDKLLRYIYRLTNVSTEEAEDILQDTFIKIYYNLNGFDPRLSFSSWAYRITHNQVISAYRKKKVRPQGHAWSIDDDQVRELASKLDTKHDVDIDYLQQNIKSVLGQMDYKYREVLILKFLEEKDYKEISDILQKPMGTIATLISRAKKQFRAESEKLGFELY